MGCSSTRDKDLEEENAYSQGAKQLLRDWTLQGAAFDGLPEALAGYRVLEVLQQTSAFTLVRAEFTCTKLSCFIKMIPKGSAALQAAFTAEAQQLLSLDHPHVLKTLEVGKDQNCVFVVSEPFYCTLQDCMGDSKFTEEGFLAKCVQQVLRALCYCHKLGVIHGKLCPANIVLRDAPTNDFVRLKVTGFGLLDELDTSKQSLYSCKDKLPTEKSDIWSCGLIVYQCLGGTVPPERLFGEPQWTERSDEAIFFVNSMLGAYTRPSAQDCLASPWLLQRAPLVVSDSQLLEKCARGLKRKATKSALKEAVQQFVIERVLKPKDTDYLLEAFNTFDRDSDGVISSSELVEQLMTVMPKTEAMATVRRTLTCREDVALPFTLFVCACMGSKRLLTLRTLRTVFRCMTSDPQGRVTLSDIRRVLDCGFLDHLKGAGLTFAEFSRLLRPSLIE